MTTLVTWSFILASIPLALDLILRVVAAIRHAMSQLHRAVDLAPVTCPPIRAQVCKPAAPFASPSAGR